MAVWCKRRLRRVWIILGDWGGSPKDLSPMGARDTITATKSIADRVADPLADSVAVLLAKSI